MLQDQGIFRLQPRPTACCLEAFWCHLAAEEELLHLRALPAARTTKKTGQRANRNQAGSQEARYQVWLCQLFLL